MCLLVECHALLKNKLLSACSGIEECRLALQKVVTSVEGFIADLHASMATSRLDFFK